MSNLSIDVITHILSFLPVRNIHYDKCMNEIKYVDAILKENKRSIGLVRRYSFQLIRFHKYILFHLKWRQNAVLVKRWRRKHGGSGMTEFESTAFGTGVQCTPLVPSDVKKKNNKKKLII